MKRKITLIVVVALAIIITPFVVNRPTRTLRSDTVKQMKQEILQVEHVSKVSVTAYRNVWIDIDVTVDSGEFLEEQFKEVFLIVHNTMTATAVDELFPDAAMWPDINLYCSGSALDGVYHGEGEFYDEPGKRSSWREQCKWKLRKRTINQYGFEAVESFDFTEWIEDDV